MTRPQALANHPLYRRKLPTMMTADEYRQHIEALGLNQIRAARFLGIADRTSRYFAAGHPIPQAIELLLRIMVAKKISAKAALRIAGLDGKEDK